MSRLFFWAAGCRTGVNKLEVTRGIVGLEFLPEHTVYALGWQLFVGMTPEDQDAEWCLSTRIEQKMLANQSSPNLHTYHCTTTISPTLKIFFNIDFHM